MFSKKFPYFSLNLLFRKNNSINEATIPIGNFSNQDNNAHLEQNYALDSNSMNAPPSFSFFNNQNRNPQAFFSNQNRNTQAFFNNAQQQVYFF